MYTRIIFVRAAGFSAADGKTFSCSRRAKTFGMYIDRAVVFFFPFALPYVLYRFFRAPMENNCLAETAFH